MKVGSRLRGFQLVGAVFGRFFFFWGGGGEGFCSVSGRVCGVFGRVLFGFWAIFVVDFYFLGVEEWAKTRGFPRSPFLATRRKHEDTYGRMRLVAKSKK